MADTSIYRGIILVGSCTGSAGQIMTSNFQELANRDGPGHSATIDPTTSNGQPNFYIWSKWLNTITNKIFICVDDTPGSASWTQVNLLSGDKTPSLAADLNCSGFGITNVSAVNSNALNSNSLTLVSNGAISLNANLVGVSDLTFVSGARTITADSINVGPIVKFGSLKMPVSDAATGYFISTDGASNLGWSSGSYPIGCIMCWPSNILPTGWLLCNGSNISRLTYVNLFNIIGTMYGVGDGSTTFGLPNLKGKMVVGSDTADVNFDNLNVPTTYVGAKTVQLTLANLPSHNHTGFPGSVGTGNGAKDLVSNAPYQQTNSTGGNVAHNNMPPYIVMNFIIRV